VRASWVILTQGDRPKDLAAAITSIVDSAATEDEIVVVGNGYDPASIEGVTTLGLPENIGIPAGRNAGIEVASGELICFLDDDARLLGPDFGSKLKHLFEADPTLGIVTFRITDVASGVSQRRHVPRVGNVDPEASSEVTSFLGGACAVRSEVLDRVGLLPGEFF
jgi:GT2 family glycosyltransferase